MDMTYFGFSGNTRNKWDPIYNKLHIRGLGLLYLSKGITS